MTGKVCQKGSRLRQDKTQNFKDLDECKNFVMKKNIEQLANYIKLGTKFTEQATKFTEQAEKVIKELKTIIQV